MINVPKFLMQTKRGWIPIQESKDMVLDNLFHLVPCFVDDKPVYAGKTDDKIQFVLWNGVIGEKL